MSLLYYVIGFSDFDWLKLNLNLLSAHYVASLEYIVSDICHVFVVENSIC